ncbi:flagellar filament capping protein FliD [Caldichromatium japonicum]|uniref:Flagellar hook-associated protein 2 n=1 Tax=Caldichromatium japonicum TaxID=2699430 RepID=A0A6G7VE42_9GAMM|nr:flagellar filament capping protein FliD [Caldichromatium japonicum]QIK38180.1 flagellar filament capping protein FliD [Caldichromatium japonicum]
MAENIIRTLGAGSGIDIKNLVSQLTAAERAPKEERLTQREERLQAQISGYGQLRSALATLKGALTALTSRDLFNARSVNVPSSDIITANKIEPGAQVGSYAIEVLETASAHTLAMPAQAARDVALDKSGTLTIQFGTWSYDPGTGDPTSFAVNGERAALSINIEASDSLDTIAKKINDQNAGVQASIVKVADQYQLMLTADSGAANALRITASPGATGLSAFEYNETTRSALETQKGRNAELRVNGLTVTRTTNEINDVIQGFSFTINKKGTPGQPLNFSITADKGAAEQAIRDFVKTYNSFQKTAQEIVGYSRDKDNRLVRGGLVNDGTARSMIERLRQQLGGAVPGIQDGFTALTNVGIRTERDGSLSINETELKEAINNKFALVERLFAGQTTSTNTAITVNQGSFSTRTVAGTYSAQITRDPTQGQARGAAITHDFGAGPLDTSGGGYAFKIQVDGITSNTIRLTGSFNSIEAVRAELQSRINGDTNLRAAGVGLDVQYDSSANAFRFVSRDYGSASRVQFVETGEEVSGSWTDNMGVLGISPTRAFVDGQAISHAQFDPATDSFVSLLDTTNVAHHFKIRVDGIESNTITLNGTFNTAEELRAALQGAIDADAKLSGAGVGVTVGYDSAANRFTFTSNSSGANSAVSFSERSEAMAALGIETALSGTRGVDVSGTINGVEGFGAGNILLPSLDSPAYGLNLRVNPGAKAQGSFEFSFARGLAGELANMIDGFTGSSGTIGAREKGLQQQLDEIKDERALLDRRMEKYAARLQAQFIAMENIVSSLRDTGKQLEGINDRLPFTAQTR